MPNKDTYIRIVWTKKTSHTAVYSDASIPISL